MNLVENLEQLDILTSQAQEHQNLQSFNFFLMPESIKVYLDDGRMLWKLNASGLFLICEERDFYYLYYFLFSERSIQNFGWLTALGKPVIIDHIYTESNRSKRLIDSELFWRTVGFTDYRVNRRMTMNLSGMQSKQKIDQSLDSNVYSIDYAQPGDIPEILNLWRNNLDRFTTPLPDAVELGHCIDQNQLIGGYSKNNNLVGALQSRKMKNIVYIDFIAVEPTHRRMGLAQALINFFLNNLRNITRTFLWVNEENKSAIKLYGKNGFWFDGKINSQLIFMK
jgi:ribosomal protein S18 acetylase RimI-like enzyme